MPEIVVISSMAIIVALVFILLYPQIFTVFSSHIFPQTFFPQIITDFFLSTDYHRLTQIFKYQRYFDYHRFISLISNHQSIINNPPNQSLWLLICANLC